MVTQPLYSLAESLTWSSFKTPPSFHHIQRGPSMRRFHQIPAMIVSGQSSAASLFSSDVMTRRLPWSQFLGKRLMLGPSTPFQRLGWCINTWAGTNSSYFWVCAMFSVLFSFGHSSQKLEQSISTQQHALIACTAQYPVVRYLLLLNSFGSLLLGGGGHPPSSQINTHGDFFLLTSARP